jgi:hypothetical protein
MPRLQVQRSVSERVAPLNAFAASHAQLLIDGVFEIRIFDVGALDRSRGAELAFRSRVSGFGTGLKIPAAKVAIPAHGIGMDAFHSRVRQNTVDRTFFTLDADVGIQLPDHLLLGRFAEQKSRQSSHSQAHDSVEAFPHKIPALYSVFGSFFIHLWPLFFDNDRFRVS